MIERLCAEIIIFVLWAFSGAAMALAWNDDFYWPFRIFCLALSLIVFVVGFKILRKELKQ